MRETGIWCILKLDQCHYTSYHSGTKLLRETYGSTVLDFFYDANGTPIAMKQNGAVYYYITNLQGDVVRLVNSAGNTAAWYKYDPYGNATTASGSHATINPLRYRGYYYDTETGLYYCQSRYYDPAIGRFINADSLVSTGQGIIGCNMFAYCGNNPIYYQDAGGTMMVPSDPLVGGPVGIMTPDSAASNTYSSGNPGSIGRRIKEILGNTDEQVVLDSEFISFYKGVPVIKLPIGNNAFSFFFIFLGDDVDERIDKIETVQHEYGHAVHLSLIGASTYLVHVFIPSVIGFHWGGDEYHDNYYSHVYEYTAEVLGGVNRKYSYSQMTEEWWIFYFLYTLVAP